MSAGGFGEFRDLVLDDRELQDLLRAESDRDRFPDLVVRLGVERGFSFSRDEVESAAREARRQWIERWL